MTTLVAGFGSFFGAWIAIKMVSFLETENIFYHDIDEDD